MTFRQKAACDIPNLIVAMDREGSFGTWQDMLNSEWLIASTPSRHSLWKPIISESQRIPNSTRVQGKWCLRDRAISHEEAPYSLSRSTDLFSGGLTFDWVLIASSSSWSLCFFFTSSCLGHFVHCVLGKSLLLMINWGCDQFETFILEHWWLHWVYYSRQGSANTSHSVSDIVLWPVIAGINWCRMASSKAVRSSVKFGIVVRT